MRVLALVACAVAAALPSASGGLRLPSCGTAPRALARARPPPPPRAARSPMPSWPLQHAPAGAQRQQPRHGTRARGVHAAAGAIPPQQIRRRDWGARVAASAVGRPPACGGPAARSGGGTAHGGTHAKPAPDARPGCQRRSRLGKMAAPAAARPARSRGGVRAAAVSALGGRRVALRGEACAG